MASVSVDLANSRPEMFGKSQVWWCTSLVSTFRGLSGKTMVLEAQLNNMVRSKYSWTMVETPTSKKKNWVGR